MFTITERPENKRVRKLISELPDRVQAIIDYFPAGIAVLVLDELRKNAPSDIDRYPGMLELRKLDLQGIDSTVGIIVPGSAHSQKLRMEDVGDTVLYVRAKRGAGGSPDPGAVILAEHNPWTMATLPYEPAKRQAVVMSRKVSPREFSKITERREAEKEGVMAQLKSIGVTPVRVHPVMIQRKVGRDIAFEVMRREFGVGGKHKAHWRPAVGMARGPFVERLLKKTFIRWLAVPSEMRWKQKVKITTEKASTAKRISAFQDLVASGGR